VRLQPVVTQNVVNYTVIIDVPNPDLKLLPGMTTNITVMVKEVKDILMVPATALRFSPPQEYIDEMMKNLPDSVKKKREKWSQGGSGVSGYRQRKADAGMIWIKAGDSIKQRRVHTGTSDGLNTEVSGKIREGDVVILGMITPQTVQAGQQQQQNPFAPQMPRSGRGGR